MVLIKNWIFHDRIIIEKTEEVDKVYNQSILSLIYLFYF